MLDRDLEDSRVTQYNLTGYPYSNRRHRGEPVIIEIVDLGDDEYIRILDERKDDTYES